MTKTALDYAEENYDPDHDIKTTGGEGGHRLANAILQRQNIKENPLQEKEDPKH